MLKIQSNSPSLLARTIFLADGNKSSQDLADHVKNTLRLAERNCSLPELKNMLEIALAVHDIGKADPFFQKYLLECTSKEYLYGLENYDHCAAGGKLLEEKGSCVALKMIATAVYCGHGLKDLINFKTGETLSETEKVSGLPEIKEYFYHIIDKDDFHELILQANTDCNYIRLKIHSTVEQYNLKCGTDQFYLGLFERLLISNLYDCDWRDAAAFENRNKRLNYRKNNCRLIWTEARKKLKSYMNQQGIFTEDLQRTITKEFLTASGKKLSRFFIHYPDSKLKFPLLLQFALHTVLYSEKNHIFYVSMSNYELPKEAEICKELVGKKNVLEYYFGHENVKKDQFQYYMEDWNTPVIFTNILHFLNAIYSGKKPYIRRMMALCNSVIIIEQPRFVPIYCTEIFNLAVNFLSGFCNSTIIFYSDMNTDNIQLSQNNLMDFYELNIENTNYNSRIRIQDQTSQYMIHTGLDLQHLIERSSFNSILISVTTRTCATKIFTDFKKFPWEYQVFLLSGNMTLCTRKETAEKIKECLSTNIPVICIATNVIKSFSDLQFEYIVKNLDALDQIISMKNFCKPCGLIDIVDMNMDHAPVDPYQVLESSRYVCKRFLHEYHNNPEIFDSLDSQKSFERYDKLFAEERFIKSIVQYPIHVYGCNSSIINLLESNPDGRSIYQHFHRKPASGSLFQALQTAGEKFDIIGHEGSWNVIVPHDEISKKLLKNLPDYGIKRNQVLNKLQKYVVKIPKYRLSEVSPYIEEKKGIWVMDATFYNSETGIKK